MQYRYWMPGKGQNTEESSPLATWEVASSRAWRWALTHGEKVDMGKGRPHPGVGGPSLAE